MFPSFCRFDFLLKRDQEFFVEPDYKTPFTSKEDAVERLMKYHLGRDRTEMDFDDFDEEFSETAVRLLDKFAAMVAKYKYLMLKESMVSGYYRCLKNLIRHRCSNSSILRFA